VFLVSGIWHGASWTFVLWGIYHGIFLLTQNLWNRYVPTLVPPGQTKRWLQTAGTFPIVCLSWVLFRANSLVDAGHVYRDIFTHFAFAQLYLSNLKRTVYGLCGVGILLSAEFLTESSAYVHFWIPELKPVRWAAYTGLAVLIALIGVFDGGQF